MHTYILQMHIFVLNYIYIYVYLEILFFIFTFVYTHIVWSHVECQGSTKFAFFIAIAIERSREIHWDSPTNERIWTKIIRQIDVDLMRSTPETRGVHCQRAVFQWLGTAGFNCPAATPCRWSENCTPWGAPEPTTGSSQDRMIFLYRFYSLFDLMLAGMYN